MARIAENLLLQRVDNILVFRNDETGAETTIPVEAGTRLTAMAAYLTNPEHPDQTWRDARAQLKEVGAL